MSVPVRYNDTKTANLRREKIAAIIAGRTPFPSDATWAYRPTMRTSTRVPRGKFFHRMVVQEVAVKLEPIAFRPSINAIDMMGCISMMGGMTVYLAIHPNGQLMRRVNLERRTKKGLADTWKPATDFAELSDEDVERMEIAAHGNDSLIARAYQDACTEIERGFGYDV
jgi:hypothetical protein